VLHLIQNDPEVPPGNISEYLERERVLYTVHHPYLGDPLPDIRDLSAVIVLGGAMGADDDLRYPFLTELKSYIRNVVSADIPYLGICLGGQLLASALGVPVVSQRWEELGSLPVFLNSEGCTDRLFDGVDTPFCSFQWHHDSFDIPETGILLASSPVCPHQTFRYGRSAWGLQFHPEVTERIIRDWCAWDSMAEERIDEQVAAFRLQEKEYRAVSQRLLANFLNAAGLHP
jgi:GMP synthase-like glutamine amidotransferase